MFFLCVVKILDSVWDILVKICRNWIGMVIKWFGVVFTKSADFRPGEWSEAPERGDSEERRKREEISGWVSVSGDILWLEIVCGCDFIFANSGVTYMWWELVHSLESLSQLNAIAEQQDKELRQLKVSLFSAEMPFKGGLWNVHLDYTFVHAKTFTVVKSLQTPSKDGVAMIVFWHRSLCNDWCMYVWHSPFIRYFIIL